MNAETGGFVAQGAADGGQSAQLFADIFRQATAFVEQHGGHLLEPGDLIADFAGGQGGAGGDFFQRRGEIGCGSLQALIQIAEGIGRRGDEAVELGGVFLQLVDDGGGFRVERLADVRQGGALMLKTGEEGADALLVGAEGALQGGHFLVDDGFQLCGALDGVLHAADQMIYLATHLAGDLGEAFGGDVVGAHQAHGGVHQGLGDLAHVLGAPQQIGRGPDEEDGQEQGDQRRGRGGQVGRREGVVHGGDGRAIDGGDGEDPEEGDEEGEPERPRGGASAHARDDGGGHGVVLVGRAHARALAGGSALAAVFRPGVFISRTLARLTGFLPGGFGHVRLLCLFYALPGSCADLRAKAKATTRRGRGNPTIWPINTPWRP